MPSKTPKPKFMTLGKSKFVHTVYTKTYDLKGKREGGGTGSGCQQVRKYAVADKIDYKAKGISPEAALALDSCEACATSIVAESLIDPEVKKADRAAARDEVLARAKGDAKKATKGKAAKIKAAREAVGKGDKPAKSKAAPTKTKAGVRSVGSDTQGKANQLAEFGKEYGWSVEFADGEPGLLLIAQKDGQTIKCWFIDGKYDIARHAYIEVGSWRGTLRGAHACRRQMEGSNAVHPNPGKGRSGPRKRADAEVEPPEDESPEDARRRVPFSLDDPAVEIIDAIRGKVIKWRNGQTGLIEEAWLPAEVRPKRAKRDLIVVKEHPKTGERYIEFLTVDSIGEHGEQYGVERAVALRKILRVAS